MSLIERAVDRLAAQTPATTPSPADADPAETTIGRLADRLAAQDTAPPAAAARPAAPKPTAASLHTSQASGEPVRLQLELLRARGFVTPDGDQSQLAQEFRVIKRPLLDNALGRGAAPVTNGRRIMVTSAFPGEGKSFNAINLALSIAAERDMQVMLVDADVAKPSVPRELGFQADRGLMDWLQADGNFDLASLVLPTNVDKLSVLPAGRRNNQSTELLASAAMNRLLDELSRRFPDHVLVFDSPPLLVTTEARVLASYMGQIVMVVEASSTAQEAVKEALATIESCEVVGMVLNKAHRAGSKAYYGGYGYGYGYAHGA